MRIISSLSAVALAVILGFLPSTSAHGEDKFITAADAKNHVGEVQTVRGKVVSAKFLADSKGAPTILNLDERYPDEVMSIVIWDSDRPKFKEPPENFYKGKTIYVTGKIILYQEKPEIVVKDPSQIVVKEK